MTLKELAHSAQQHLQTLAGVPVKRSHVHELLAAAFGYSSWAAFRSESLLADAGVGKPLASKSPQLIGRAVQLGYGQAESVLLADAVVALAMARQVSCIRWMDVRDALVVAPVLVDENRLDDEDVEWDDKDEPPRPAPIAGPDPHRFLSSPLLVDSLQQMADGAAGEVHQVLATMYRCKRPNPYLYEESLKGRQLTRIEQGWVDEYLVAEPRFRKYEAHLKAAALGGLRPAAVEYAALSTVRSSSRWPSAWPGTWTLISWRRSPRRRTRAPHGCGLRPKVAPSPHCGSSHGAATLGRRSGWRSKGTSAHFVMWQSVPSRKAT